MSVYIRSRSTTGVKVEICSHIFFGLQQIVPIRVFYKLPLLSRIIWIRIPKAHIAQWFRRVSAATPYIKCVPRVCVILKYIGFSYFEKSICNKFCHNFFLSAPFAEQ